MRRAPRISRVVGVRGTLGVAALAAAAAGCNENFTTGSDRPMTLSVANWSDTLVLGDQRAVRVRVLDDQQREVLDARVRWDVGTASVLGSRLNGTGATQARIDGVGSRDSVQLNAAQPGKTGVTLSLTDPRFGPVTQPLTATVVVASVRVASAHDTTMTTLGDTAAVRGTAYARAGAGASLTPVAGQGVTWTRRGPGAVALVGTGAAGDSVRAVAVAPGTDTLIATHPFCLAGARCADTTVMHVAPALQAMGLAGVTFRAWAFGDSVAPQVVVQDSRGNAVAGVQLSVAPVTAADSAIVGVNTAAGVPASERTVSALAATPLSASLPGTPRSASRAATRPIATRPYVLVIPTRAAAAARQRPAASLAAVIAPVAPQPVSLPPLVAQANGTARVAVRATLPGGTLVGSDTMTVIVRQVANVVHVAPAYSDLTPGDSIPVHVEARDARGHLIQDATFQPEIAGAIYRDGRVVVSSTATAGTGLLQALVTGVASPSNNPGAPIPVPPPDTARVVVRVPPPVVAGDTTAAAANSLDFTVRDRDGNPLRNTWVRFHIPGGLLQGPDSVESDQNGAVALRWTPPTQPGSYTATAVLLGAPATADSAGIIVLRRTVVVASATASALAVATAPPAAATLGAALSPAPVVQIVDPFGNPIRQAGVVVTAALPPGTAGAFAWGGTLSAPTDGDGRAHFTALTGTGAVGDYPLQFSAAVNAVALRAVVTPAIRFTAGAAQNANSTVTISAVSVASGTTALVVVTPRDASGALLGPGQPVTITVPATSPNGQATATTTAVTDRGDGTYAATLTGVRAGTALPVGVSVGGVALVGPSLAVTAGAATVLRVSPATQSLAAFGPGATFAATAADAAGNPASLAGLAWSSSATGVAVVAANGTPTAAGNGTATITATLGALNATASLTVQQVVAGLSKYAGDGQSAAVASPVAAAVIVRAVDANQFPVVGASVQFAVAGGGGTVGNGATQSVTTVANGLATAPSWVMGHVVGANSLSASTTGAGAVAFTATANAGPAAALTIVTQPPAAAAMNAALSPAPVVQLVDSYGNAVQTGGVTVTASLPPSAGTGFTWGGTLTAVTASNGRATFSAITGSGTVGNRGLQFDAAVGGTALTPALSTAVHFAAGGVSAPQSTITVSAASVVSGARDTVVVTPRDGSGNLIGAGQTVVVTVPASPASGQATATVSAVVDRGDGTYVATLTGIRAGTAFAVGATVNSVGLAGPSVAVTAGPATVLQISPTTATLAAFGAGAPFTATATDANGNATSTAGLAWSSSATSVATIAAGGTPTAAANGTTTITATLSGVHANATLTVQQTVATLAKQAGDGQTATIQTAVATPIAVHAVDAHGFDVVGAPIQFAVATGGGTVNGGTAQLVTTGAGGIATAGSWVLGPTVGAATNTVTASTTGAASVTFAGTGGPALALSVTSTERLVRGTQQFGVAAGPAGPYTWTVGGVAGGNSTLGTVSSSGFFTAPTSVPAGGVVQVCASAGPATTQRACAAVSVVTVPTAGGDIIVMNDNVPLSNGIPSAQFPGGLDGTHAPNAQFLANLVGYGAAGARASQTHVLVYQGHGALNLQNNPPFDAVNVPGSGLDTMRVRLAAQGFTMDTSRAATLTIPANVKVLLLYMPTVAFSTAEVNAIKQFAAQGGRAVFVGNQTAYYGAAGVGVENALMAQLGSALVNTNAVLLTGSNNNGANATPVGTAHQVMSMVSGVWFDGCSYMAPGPNDYALMTDGASGHVVMAVTKIDVTPLP